jgi:DNA-binding MarR family transcriptional regulator
MFDSRIKRLLDAYPAIFLACHRQHVREDEAGKAITEHQASVLNHLHATRPTTLSKLAEHMGISRSTMSITVARLVRGGYITRDRDKNDARCVGLTLTLTGVRVKEQNTVLDAHRRIRNCTARNGVPGEIRQDLASPTKERA